MPPVELASIRTAAARAHASILGVGNEAFYPYPDDNGEYFGFSYTIPKEEQLRSEFYRHLDTHDGDGPRFELEWNLYERHAGARSDVVKCEIDLVGFHKRAIVAALEVKRAWRLKGWNNKPQEQLDGIASDLGKLEGVLGAVGSGARRPLAGVIVARFTDSADNRRELESALSTRFPRIEHLHVGEAIICEESSGRELRNVLRKVWCDLDLVLVDY